MFNYLKNIGILFSQGLNTIFFAGSPDETLSSRAYRLNWKIYPIIDKIFWFDNSHCKESFEMEKERKHFGWD